MNKKNMTKTIALLGTAIFAATPIFMPLMTNMQPEDYAFVIKNNGDKGDDDDDDDKFNGVRFKLFFPNRT